MEGEVSAMVPAVVKRHTVDQLEVSLFRRMRTRQ